MTLELESDGVAGGVLESQSDQKLVFLLPHTEYRLHLVSTVPANSLATPVGKRIKGTIRVRALRMFKANGGGRFIEPISGEPRIVAGQVMAVDVVQRRVLVDVAVPMWMTPPENQSLDTFTVGDLVNCYVESGATFTPVA